MIFVLLMDGRKIEMKRSYLDGGLIVFLIKETILFEWE